jgi:hypothetical protein
MGRPAPDQRLSDCYLSAWGGDAESAGSYGLVALLINDSINDDLAVAD